MLPYALLVIWAINITRIETTIGVKCLNLYMVHRRQSADDPTLIKYNIKYEEIITPFISGIHEHPGQCPIQ